MRKYILIGLILIFLLAALFYSQYFFSRQANRKAIPTVQRNGNVQTDLSNQVQSASSLDPISWTEIMLNNFPYKKGSYSGVMPGGNKTEVWIVGKRISSPVFNSNYYIGVSNKWGQFFGRLTDNPVYSVQVGDNLNSESEISTSSSGIKIGDPVGIRATYLDDFMTVSEVRLLLTDQNHP